MPFPIYLFLSVVFVFSVFQRTSKKLTKKKLYLGSTWNTGHIYLMNSHQICIVYHGNLKFNLLSLPHLFFIILSWYNFFVISTINCFGIPYFPEKKSLTCLISQAFNLRATQNGRCRNIILCIKHVTILNVHVLCIMGLSIFQSYPKKIRFDLFNKFWTTKNIHVTKLSK